MKKTKFIDPLKGVSVMVSRAFAAREQRKGRKPYTLRNEIKQEAIAAQKLKGVERE